MSEHFTPWSTDLHPCWHCRSYAGLLYDGAAASCRLVNGPRVRAVPERGCSAFEREPGADDDLRGGPAGWTAAEAHSGPWKAQDTHLVPAPGACAAGALEPPVHHTIMQRQSGQHQDPKGTFARKLSTTI
jgi:hypothetical protein